MVKKPVVKGKVTIEKDGPPARKMGKEGTETPQMTKAADYKKPKKAKPASGAKARC